MTKHDKSDDEADEDPFDELTACYLAHLESGAAAPDLSAFSGAERIDAEEHLRVLRALWGADSYEVPALGEDPVAIRFGFDRLGPTVRVSGHRLRDERKAANLRTSELATRLAELGQSVGQQRLGEIERAQVSIVPMGLASAMAAALDISVAAIEAIGQPAGAVLLDDFLASPLFGETVGGWASDHRADPRQVVERAKELLAAARFRSGDVHTAADWQAVLMAILDANPE